MSETKKIQVQYIKTERSKRRYVKRLKPSPLLIRRFRNISIAAGILLVMLLAAGLLYAMITDRQPANVSAQKTSGSNDTGYQPVKPVQPAPNVDVGMVLNTLTSPVAIGTEASLDVNTTPDSKCTATLMINNVASSALGLSPETSDAYGNVLWNWDVTNATPLGTWPIKITCVHGIKSGVVDGNITVTKS